MTTPRRGPADAPLPAAGDPVASAGCRTPAGMRWHVASGPVWMLPAWIVLLVVPVVHIVSAGRWGEVFSAGAWALTWIALDVGFGVPRAQGAPTWWRWLSVGMLVAALASRAARGGLGTRWHLTDLVSVIALAAVGAAWVYDHRARVRRVSPVLEWPLAPGRWLVVQGANRLLNHHWVAPRQRAALDVVGLGRFGRPFTGWVPRRLEEFVAAGAPVRSPVAGRVIVAFDDAPALPTSSTLDGIPAAGNHVVVDGGACRVLLAHLEPGSMKVAVGDHVAAGDLLGRVGTSGSSTQPHLHIHAIDDDGPLRLRFRGVRGSGRRGAIVRR